MPPGYTVQYGGQFENQERAAGCLMVIVPIVIFVVFIMLWMTFGTLKHAFVIMLNVPLVLTGGIIGLYVMGAFPFRLRWGSSRSSALPFKTVWCSWHHRYVDGQRTKAG